LQTTSTTSGEMFTAGFHPVLRGSNNLDGATFIIVTLLIVAPKRHFFSGQRAINKTGFAINAPYTSTVITEVDNLAVEGLLVDHGLTLFFWALIGWLLNTGSLCIGRDSSRTTQPTREMNYCFGQF
jgi:hypothetical protein